VHLERIIPFAERKEFERTVIDRDFKFRDLDELGASREPLEDGDIVTFFRIAELPRNRVHIEGHVNKPGPAEWKPGMRVRDLVLAADSLRRSAFVERGTLFRLLPNLRREVLSFDLRKALEGIETENLILWNEDSVVVYSERQFFPEHTVSIYGAIRKPGTFRRVENLTVSDLVVMAGGLAEGASLAGWEISRLDTTQIGRFRKIFTVNVDEEFWQPVDGGAFPLQDFDAVFVPSDPRYTEARTVKISGYVMYPGTYTIKSEGERLSDLFSRAGGLRQGAYLEGSRLTRAENGAGLVPVDYRRALDDPASRENIVLRAGDSISVPMTEDLVYVTGEVYVPSPVVYKRGEDLDYYIEQAGNFTTEAEEGKTVVFLPGGKRWEEGEILPGSSIFVPKHIEKEDKLLPIIRDTAAILVSVAALTVALIQVTK
jgi:protein involved in polysaccharide export with SLBB domain